MVANGSNPVERSYDAWGKQRFTSGQDDTGNTLLVSNATTDAEPRGFIGQEQVAAVNLVDLNRRLYDPWVGRFLAADPIIASVGDAQALNPYAYAGNNPPTNLDPSGASWFSSFFKHNSQALESWFVIVDRVIASIVATVVTMGTFAQAAGYSMFASETGDISAFTMMAADSPALAMADTALAGAVGGAISTGTLRGTLIGAATAEAFWGVGEIKVALGDELSHTPGLSPQAAGGIYGASAVALHAAVGCVSSAAGGGRCGSGAVSGGLGEITTGFAAGLSNNVFVQSAVVGLGGGAGSALTGGRFGEGFFIPASGYLFNECGGGHGADCSGSPATMGLNGGVSSFDDATGFAYQQLVRDLSDAIDRTISFFVGVSGEETLGYGVTAQGGIFFTPGTGNAGLFGTGGTTMGSSYGLSSVIVGAQVGSFSGAGQSYNISTPYGGVSASDGAITYSSPSARFGASIATTQSCYVSLQGHGC